MGTRVVLDTNVLISALGWNGVPGTCLELVLSGDIAGYISPAIMDELNRVLHYPRFEFTAEERERFLTIVDTAFHLVRPEVELTVIVEDPDDNAILECAVTAGAAYIVSGDIHLHRLGTFDGIEIVTPAEFIQIVDKDDVASSSNRS